MGSSEGVSLFAVPQGDERFTTTGICARRRHHPGLCHYCFAMPPDPISDPLSAPLLRCAQCQLVLYCSKTCQKKDWPQHKNFCKANKAVDGKSVLSSLKEKMASGSSWNQATAGLSIAAALNMKTRLKPYQQEIFQFPRVCAVCYDADPPSLACCPCCYSVFYCSSQHRDRDLRYHERHCSSLLLLLQCDRLEARHGIMDVPIPRVVDEYYKNLPDKLMTLLEPQLSTASDTGQTCNLDPRVVTIISERLSFPLSLLYALQEIGVGVDNTPVSDITELKVHVLGATTISELLGIIRWEYMIHRLPNVRKMHICFIGPEVFGGSKYMELSDDELSHEYGDHMIEDNGLTTCDDCKQKSRTIVHELANMCYHSFIKTPYYSTPDVIVAFNCGFHEYNGQEENTWRESLPLLVQDPAVPLVFTSYTAQEAALDLATLQRASQLRILMPPHENPFSSLRPYRDPETIKSQVFYWNKFITCVRGVSKEPCKIE